jgi:hypothetical protein
MLLIMKILMTKSSSKMGLRLIFLKNFGKDPRPHIPHFLFVGLCEKHSLRASTAHEFAGPTESYFRCFGRSKNGYGAVSLARY